MAHIYENELETELYEKILELSKDLRKNEEEIANFKKEDISTIREVYEKYKDHKSISVQFLFVFLSYYFLLNNSDEFIKNEPMDVTKSYPYFDLIVDKYDSRGIL